MLTIAFWRDCLETSREEKTNATSIAILAEVRECERGQEELVGRKRGSVCDGDPDCIPNHDLPKVR